MKNFIFLFLGIISITFTSCSTADAEVVADEFHQKLDAGELDYIVDNLADLDGTTTREDWYGFLNLVTSWGPQKNRQRQSGFSKSINNGIAEVALKYQFDIEGTGTVYERIVLINRGEQYKILSVLMDPDESIVDRDTSND